MDVRKKTVVLGAIAACLIAAAFSQDGKNIPRATDVVKPKAYVSMAPIARGGIFELAVVAEIIPGFHVNANKPNEEYLIPTTVKAELPAGLTLNGTEYPEGKLVKFEFSEKKLSVYEGRALIRLKMQAANDAPLGKTKVSMILRYQACNDSACLPPAKLPVEVEFEIAPLGVKSRPVNLEIFKSK